MNQNLQNLIEMFKTAAGKEIAMDMVTCQTFSDLVEQCGKTAKSHGFWDAHLMKALRATGVSRETYESWIKEHDLSKVEPEDSYICGAIEAHIKAGIIGDPAVFLALIGTEISEAIEADRKDNWTGKDGVFEELADAFIRGFDFVARYGPSHGVDGRDFLQLIQAKMAKNESRPHLHGKGY